MPQLVRLAGFTPPHVAGDGGTGGPGGGGGEGEGPGPGGPALAIGYDGCIAMPQMPEAETPRAIIM